jgi:hypothetical protein
MIHSLPIHALVVQIESHYQRDDVPVTGSCSDFARRTYWIRLALINHVIGITLVHPLQVSLKGALYDS